MDETSKKCFECGRVLPLSSFNKNPTMADGHLNQCKECKKKYNHNRYIKNKQDESYSVKEQNEAYKQCFKCGRFLSLSSFYKHPQMADGHLNQCKECTKKDVQDQYKENRQDESYVAKERARGRNKYKRLYGNFNPEIFDAREKKQKFYDYSPAAARSIRPKVKRRGIMVQPSEQLHHWSYAAPNEVFVVAKKTHYAIHHLTRYFEESNCFRDLQTGEYLDSAGKYKRWLKNNGLRYRLFICLRRRM